MTSKNILIFILLTVINFASSADNCPSYKAVVCHAGSENNPNFVEICVSFSSLYGHLAEHSLDYYGECSLRNVKPSYVCNAGMRQKDVDSTTCIKRDGDFEEYVESCGDSKNCTCGATKDLYKFDYFNYEISDFDPRTLEISNTAKQSKVAGKDLFKVATSEPAFTKLSEDRELSFYIGSERMNAEYFVDSCWMNTTGMEDYNLDFKFTSQVETDLYTGTSYPVSSGLHTKLSLYCDMDYDGVTNYSTATLINSTQYAPFSSGQSFSHNYSIVDSEFCFLRQSFVEIYPNVMRPHDLKKITVQNNLESLEKVVVDKAVEICHVQEISKNGGNGTNNSYSSLIDSVTVGLPFQTEVKKKVYECTNLRFRNSDHLKQYVSFAKDSKDFRDIHQHDYVGICNNICGPIHGNGAN